MTTALAALPAGSFAIGEFGRAPAIALGVDEGELTWVLIGGPDPRWVELDALGRLEHG